MKTKGYQIGY